MKNKKELKSHMRKNMKNTKRMIIMIENQIIDLITMKDITIPQIDSIIIKFNPKFKIKTLKSKIKDKVTKEIKVTKVTKVIKLIKLIKLTKLIKVTKETKINLTIIKIDLAVMRDQNIRKTTIITATKRNLTIIMNNMEIICSKIINNNMLINLII